MKDFFKPEDFETAPSVFGDRYKAAEIANEKLNKLIESWPVVYGFADKSGWYLGGTCIIENATHRARLVFIEEIKKEPCTHEPFEYESKFITEGFFPANPGFYSRSETASAILINPKCKHCGVELQATWTTKGEK